MKLIVAEQASCTSCGLCVEMCPMEIIVLDQDGFPGPGASAERLCINCGYCVDVCPTSALHHRFRKRRLSGSASQRRDKAPIPSVKG